MRVELGHVRLQPAARGWVVDYRRPQWSNLLVDLSFAEAERRATRLHGLCGVAHRIALARAAEGGAPVAPERAAARELLLRVEQVEAMARRLALEFTSALDLVPAPEIAAPVLRAAATARAAIGLASARGPLAPTTTLAAAFADLAAALAEAVAGCPKLPGQRLAVLGPRLAALVSKTWAAPARRLADLATAIEAWVPTVVAAPAETELVDGGGEAAAVTYRGPVTYDVAVIRGRIKRAAWTTPTDRRFGSNGLAPSALAELDRRIVGDADLALAMCALDPCVPWSVEGRIDA